MATVQSTNQLNFRIFHCTSQDPQYPVNELMSMNNDPSQSRGWHSQRFCVYPQEIVLQFPSLVHLKQVQFLVHQSKIPSVVELFSYAPDFAAGAGALVSINNPQISFTRLGHFSLDDNVRTNYQARELKTVYLEQYCQYLKIVCNKNHLNSLNIFNQVAIVQVTCVGSYMGDYEVNMIANKTNVPSQVSGYGVADPSMLPRNMKIQSINEDELDPTIVDKIRTLNSAKTKAVESDDFDKAKTLKEVIDKLKMAGTQLMQLEIQKKMAIENEDFDSAKVLKYEIDRLRSMAMTLDTDRVILTPIRQTRMGTSMAASRHQQDPENFEDMRSQRPQDDNDDMLSVVNEEIKEGQVKMDRSFREEMTERSGMPAINQQSFKIPKNAEDSIVPAHGLKKPIDFNTVGDNDFDGGQQLNDPQEEELKMQNISTTQRPIADAILPFVGEQITLLLFAKAWQNREKGISMLITKISEILQKDTDQANTALLQVMTECLKDKVQQVTVKSFLLVESYVQAIQKNKSVNPKTEISNTEKMLVQLLDKLADSRYRQKAEQAFLKFFGVEQIEGGFLVGFLMKGNSFINKKLATSFKHAVPRLAVILQLVEDFSKYEQQKKFTQQSFPFASVYQKCKEGMEASNAEQRKVSSQIVCSIYKQFGFKKVEALVGDLTIKSLELLLKDVPEVEPYIKLKKQQKKE